MGIESDQLVYDYLSRVGDLAQQRQLPSADRMRLVAGLRQEIERRRSAADDSPGAVRRILGGLGAPEEIVAGAGGVQPAATGAAEGDTAGAGAERAASEKRPDLEKRPAGDGRAGRPQPSVPSRGASPVHLAGTDELTGPGTVPGQRTGGEPEWWRVDVPGFTADGPGPRPGAEPTGAFGVGAEVPGFTGGIELPEILKPPPPPGAADPKQPAPDAAPGAAEKPRPNLLRRLVTRRRPAPAEAAPAAPAAAPRRVIAPMVLLAALLLIAGAVSGSLIALALGWLVAYGGTRLLSRNEARLAALGLPGLVAGGALLWLWGRGTGRWGEPLPMDRFAEALSDTWPVVVRVAAVASAAYLLWRAARPRA